MIARQRQNLGLTFTATQQKHFSAALRERVTRNETELLDATQEFTTGWEARTGPSPDLQAAILAMQSALDQLSLDDAQGAVDGELQALASLIRARQNIRQELSQSQSSSSACRTFDRQQQQRLRKPEELKKDRNQEITAQRQNLENLAQQQRKWSEDVQSGPKPRLDRDRSEQETPANPSEPSSASSASKPSDSSQSKPSAEQLAQRQQELIDEWRKMREQLSGLAQSTEATKSQADEIAQSMQRGLNSQQRGNERTAAQEGEAAAEMLEQLADHLATWQSEDVLERLAQAHELAERLAQREGELGEHLAARAGTDPAKIGPLPAADLVALAGRQQGLTAQAGLLAEQLDRLRGEASVSAPRAADALQQVEQEHAPRDIAQEMSIAAIEISQGNARAPSTVRGAQQRLEQLAAQLQDTRADLGQPRLDELLALEEDVARAIEQLENQQTPPALADAEQSSLADRLSSLAAADRRMEQALSSEANLESADNSAAETQSGSPSNYVPHGNSEVRPGVYWRSSWMTPSRLRQANQVVQRKIQEIILAGAQLDGDAPVPPEYAPLVEEYYRQLSDDLR